jgi:hypothetical protein
LSWKIICNHEIMYEEDIGREREREREVEIDTERWRRKEEKKREGKNR